MTNIKLYDDQIEFVTNLRASFSRGYKSVLGVASPAFGKTVVAAYITETATGRGQASCWFLVHRKNLLRQTSNSFWQSKIPHGLITSGKMRSPLPVQVGTIGTVFNRMGHLKPPTILFIDEAHLCRGRMFETVILWAKEQGALIIGLTGTPQRLDGKALGYLFDDMVESRSPRWLIEQGRLSSYVIYSTPRALDLSGVKTTAGDYDKAGLEKVMDTSAIIGDAVSHWRKYANGMITVAYCVTVAHSKHTAAQFNANGIPAVHVDAGTTEAELKEACEGLASGRYLIMCNCELVIEGFDLSAQVGKDITIQCCMLLRATKSLTRYLQMVFRALRKKDQPAVILDHAQCVMTHGFPDDEREWSLEGKKKGRSSSKDEEPDVNVQQCHKCYFVFRKGATHCPGCGCEVEVMTPRKINEVEGELVKIDVEAERRNRKLEQGSARGLYDLVRVGVSRGMKNPSAWASIVFAQRQKRKPTPAEFQQAKQYQREIEAQSVI